MTREELKYVVKELQAQDKDLFDIFNRREEIAKEAKESGLYDELWEMLFADGKRHYNF